MRFALASVFVTVVACGGSFPRESTANNTRTDDPWLDGEHCSVATPLAPKLQIEDLEAGPGPAVDRGETVRVHYVAATLDGRTLHDTHDGGPPIQLVLGSGNTICGFDRALVGMHAGAKRRVVVPWQLAFGEAGRAPDVPPKTDLVFVVDLYLPAEATLDHSGSPSRMPGGTRRR
jgi:peptidylprolyl isomerase